MPSNYAQYRFGVNMLQRLPGDIRRPVQRYRRLYDIGLHGPDIFYYYISVLRSSAGFLGIKFHEQSGKEFFQRVCRGVRLEGSEGALACLYGLLSHYCLDSVLSPVIAEQAERSGVTSLEMETEFDRFLLEKDGKLPPYRQNLTAHLKISSEDAQVVARFYPPATGKNVQEALSAMRLALRLLTAPEGSRRMLLEKGIRAGGRKTAAMLMTVTPNPRCADKNEALLEAYEKAEQRFTELLPQLMAHMTYNAPLEAPFDKTFDGK